jgi:hypothetical protein
LNRKCVTVSLFSNEIRFQNYYKSFAKAFFSSIFIVKWKKRVVKTAKRLYK